MPKYSFYGPDRQMHLDRGMLFMYQLVTKEVLGGGQAFDWETYVLLKDGTWYKYEGFDLIPDNVLHVEEI